MRLCLTLLCAIVFPAVLHAQNPDAKAPATAGSADTIHAGAQLVILDVNVNGADGAAVRHLTKEDFTVLENGVTQRIDRCEEHIASADGGALPKMPRLPPGTYSNYSPVPVDGPLNVILLDTLNTPVDSQMVARQKIIAFLQTLKPAHHVAVFGLSTRLYLLQGFTSDPALLQAVLSGKRANAKTSPLLSDPLGTESLSDQAAGAWGNSPGAEEVVANLQQFEAIVATEQLRNRAVITLTAMNQLARYLNGQPGRKNLIWMSGSFPLNVMPDADAKNPFAAVLNMEDSFRETTNLLARSQVAVYPVDARGLFVAPMFSASVSGSKYGRNTARFAKDLQTFSTTTIDEHATMTAMADATGGKAYVNGNDLGGAVDAAFHAGANYYTLVYSPSNRDWDSRYRKIVVRTKAGTSYSLNYRRGYYADDPNRRTLDHDNTAATRPAGSIIDPLNAAMQRGAPEPTQLLLKAKILALPGTSNRPAEGSVAAAKARPPYRTFNVYIAGNTPDFDFEAQPDGGRTSALQLAAIVYDAEGRPVTLLSRNKQATFSPAGFQQVLNSGLQLQEQISVPAKGDYFLRLGLRDKFSGKVGAIEVPINTVPSPAPAPH